jgi:hypothetical protein
MNESRQRLAGSPACCDLRRSVQVREVIARFSLSDGERIKLAALTSHCSIGGHSLPAEAANRRSQRAA